MMRMFFDAGFGRSGDARYLPERKEAECNTALVQGNSALQPLSRAITEFTKEPRIFISRDSGSWIEISSC
jgi:hypothetical protein